MKSILINILIWIVIAVFSVKVATAVIIVLPILGMLIMPRDELLRLLRGKPYKWPVQVVGYSTNLIIIVATLGHSIPLAIAYIFLNLGLQVAVWLVRE